MTTPIHRWYHVTPARFFIGLLAVQVFLLLSERFQWFALNEQKGWTVLIAIGVLCVAVLVMLVWALVCLCLRRRFQFSFRSLLLFVVAVSALEQFVGQVRRVAKPDDTVLVICRSGNRSAAAVEMLAQAGFKRSYTVVDGFEGDKNSDPSSPDYGKRTVNGWKNAGLPWTR